MARSAVPRLTAAQHPVEEMGEDAVKFLVQLLEDRARPPMNRLLQLPIILRESTAAMPQRFSTTSPSGDAPAQRATP